MLDGHLIICALIGKIPCLFKFPDKHISNNLIAFIGRVQTVISVTDRIRGVRIFIYSGMKRDSYVCGVFHVMILCRKPDPLAV